ncbi:MAG: insulinase family protein [Candidatus Eremiobacteraeota bacterium]|nr:insulinase family protein [Candidatus Eremiobacteraeota bacterium]
MEAGSLKILVGTSPRHVDRAKDTILSELSRLKEKKISRKELSRAKRFLLGLYEIKTQTNQSKASRFAYHEALGLGADFSTRFPGEIRKITCDDVLRMARKYLDLQRYSLSLILPLN